MNISVLKAFGIYGITMADKLNLNLTPKPTFTPPPINPTINLTPNTTLGPSHLNINATDKMGAFSTGARITHNITPNLSAHVGASTSRIQSFQGHGGFSNHSVGTGFSWRF